MQDLDPDGPPEPPIDWVSASEIGEYMYCARSHWLQRVRRAAQDPTAAARLAAGVVAHQAHGAAVEAEISSAHEQPRPSLLPLAALVFVLAALLAALFVVLRGW